MSNSNKAPENAVIVFTVANCGQCTATKQSLAKHGIPFTEIDLNASPEILARLKTDGWKRAPIIQTPDGQSWSGFRPDRIRDLTNPKGLRAPSTEAYRSPTSHKAAILSF